MNYYIKELKYDAKLTNTAGTKARNDVNDILENVATYNQILISANTVGNRQSVWQRLNGQIFLKRLWDEATSKLTAGDTLFIQFPIVNFSLFLPSLLKKLKSMGVKLVFLIHDLESLRLSLRKDTPLKQRVKLVLEEKNILGLADKLIVHNDKMKEHLLTEGYSENGLVSLEIFDYLIPGFDDNYRPDSFQQDLPVIIAGNLRKHKAAYAYDLPSNVAFNLYGVDYEGEEQSTVTYKGAFPPDSLPFSMSGSFGLIWDGETSSTCSGIYGQYLKFNNSHKASLYLASGLPVIIWTEAALASFILSNNVGLTVDSLEDLPSVFSNLTEEDYNEKRANAVALSKKLRQGYYLLRALEK